ncbi:MAG: N-acetyl-gamma-glutamyl-phosphate reductase [Chloroflexi bacterium]|nr:N-acetyl-gamma-glutamyl-phosphate reductase [Chloroflexota bacterium]
MIRAGIIGASAYGAAELFRLLAVHPELKITYAASESGAGKPVAEVFPQLRGGADLSFEPYDSLEAVERADVFFLPVKNGLAMEMAPSLIGAGRKVVDFSADFRLKDLSAHRATYGMPHTCPDLLAEAVYGLPEINRDAIREARLVANPGCYPTAAILSLIPLLRGRSGAPRDILVDPGSIIVDAYSAVSGAGRSSVSLKHHFPEVNDSLTAYSVVGHRHVPEIEEVLQPFAGFPLAITFTPHLAPIGRGILSTTYATLRRDLPRAAVRELFESAYAPERFVVLLPEGEIPRTGAVRGSNFVHVSVHFDPRLRRVTVIAAEDNLVKGAAGQAVQNMNLLCGLVEDTGLGQTGLYP